MRDKSLNESHPSFFKALLQNLLSSGRSLLLSDAVKLLEKLDIDQIRIFSTAGSAGFCSR